MVENTNAREDLRRHKRIDTNLPIQYKNIRKTGEIPIGSLTRNLSEGGVCFKSGEFISLACRLALEISLPTESKPVKAISKVVWIKKDPSTGQYELGSKFLDMAEEDRARIAILKS